MAKRKASGQAEAEPSTGWRNRIVGHAEVDPAEIVANPRNWRVHPDAQRAALGGVLDEVGWVGSVTLNKSTGFCVDGHLRVALALDRKERAVPVTFVELTEAEEALVLATLDPISALATASSEKLAALLENVNPNSEAVSTMLSALAERSGLHAGTGAADPGAQIDRAEELREKWGTERGQAWQVGRHRLVCGDCTSKADNDVLLVGAIASLGVTSPPYAVGKEYEDGVSFGEHIAMLEAVADRSLEAIEPGGFFFVNFGEIASLSHASKLTGSKRQCIYPISRDYWRIFHEERGCDLYAQRVWYKPFNRLQQPFWTYHTSIPHHQEWEHIWTWRVPGGEGDEVHDWDISSRAVWDTRQESTDDKPLTRHVAAFPVCLPERAIRAHSSPGAIVWEPFLGSGTTMVAAEQLGRTCYGMEIEPKYVAVVLERMAGMGLEPRLEA